MYLYLFVLFPLSKLSFPYAANTAFQMPLALTVRYHLWVYATHVSHPYVTTPHIILCFNESLFGIEMYLFWSQHFIIFSVTFIFVNTYIYNATFWIADTLGHRIFSVHQRCPLFRGDTFRENGIVANVFFYEQFMRYFIRY